MSASLIAAIAAIVVLVLVLIGLGILWLVRVPRSALFRAYQETSRVAARDDRENAGSRRGPEWR